MPVNIKQLKENGTQFYPETHTEAVIDGNGDTLDTVLAQLESEIHPDVELSQPAGGMLPNVLYRLGTLTDSVTITFATPSDANIENMYKFTFETSSTPPTITWPNTIVAWFGGSAPTISASKHYEVNVIDGYAYINEF